MGFWMNVCVQLKCLHVCVCVCVCMCVCVCVSNQPCQSAYYKSSLWSKQTCLFLNPSNPQPNHPSLANLLALPPPHSGNTHTPSCLSMAINIHIDSMTHSNIYVTTTHTNTQTHTHTHTHTHAHTHTHKGQRRVSGFIANTTHPKIYSSWPRLELLCFPQNVINNAHLSHTHTHTHTDTEGHEWCNWVCEDQTDGHCTFLRGFTVLSRKLCFSNLFKSARILVVLTPLYLTTKRQNRNITKTTHFKINKCSSYDQTYHVYFCLLSIFEQEPDKAKQILLVSPWTNRNQTWNLWLWLFGHILIITNNIFL